MAVLVGNDTYKRFVFDHEEGEAWFVIEGLDEPVDAEGYAAAVKENPDLILERWFIKPDEGAKKIWITYRPLAARDQYAINDLRAADGVLAQGNGRRLMIKRAVLAWDFEVPWSEAILDQLDVSIEQQIFEWISYGVEPPEQDPETGQRILPLVQTKPNRAQRRAAASSSPKKKTTHEQDSPDANDGDSTS